MSLAAIEFSEDSSRSLDTPCLCHGLVESARWYKNKRASRLPMTSQVSLEAIRPALELAVNRTIEAQGKVPAWSQRKDLERVPLLRADRWIEEASARLREPALGLHALSELSRGAGEVVEFAAECAGTLRDALLVLTRYSSILNEAASLHLHVHGATAVLAMRSRIFLSHAVRDFLAGAIALGVARWLGSCHGLELWFAGPRPTYTFAYRRALHGINVGFHAPCDALVIPAEWLLKPLPLADAKRHSFLVGIADRLASHAY